MWSRAANAYGQIPGVRSLWARPTGPDAPARDRDDAESDAGSFLTADEGASSLRVHSPEGGLYAPSVPSSAASGAGRAAGRGAPVVVEPARPARFEQQPAPTTPPTYEDATRPPLSRDIQATYAEPSHGPPRAAAVPPPHPAPVPPSMNRPAPPAMAGGLMDRLKAQRAARATAAAATEPALTAAPSPRSPPSGQPFASSASAPRTSLPVPSRAPTLHPSPPLQPFHSPPASSELLPHPRPHLHDPNRAYTPPQANAPISYDSEAAYSPRPWHDGFSYVGPAAAAAAADAMTPSRSSDRTVLNEAQPLSTSTGAHAHAMPAPVQRAGPPSRGQLLEWERQRREAERGADGALRESPSSRDEKAETVRSSWGWEEATEGLRSGRRSPAGRPEQQTPQTRVDEILMQDWLLLPPLDRPVTDGLLSFPDLWHPTFAVLTPSLLYLIDHDDPVVVFAVADLVHVQRILKHARDGFEPFFVELRGGELRGGERLYFAGTQELDGALWTLKLKNAHSGAYRRSSTLSDLPDVDVSPAASSRSSRTSPRRQATSPPTSVSPSRHAPPFAASRNLASPADDQPKNDSHWMHSFNSDVRVHPVLEELPPHAGPDDWGRSPSPSSSAWPARPPTETYEPPSPPSPPSTVRLQAQHALQLGVMRDRLEFVRAVSSGEQEGLQGDVERAREAAQELEMLREDVLQMAEREGRALTLDEERLFEKIEWLEHLNAARLDPSAEQEELARTLEEEERLAIELQRELAALGVPAHGAGDWEGWSRDGEERSGGSRPSTRQDKAHLHVRGERQSSRGSTPRLPAQPVNLTSKFSSNSSAPRRYRHSPRDARPTLSPVPPSADYRAEYATPEPRRASERSSSDGDEERSEARRRERRRRLQALFLELEERVLAQTQHLAASEEKNRKLTRTLAKLVNLVEHSSHAHSSQVSALLDRLDALTAQLQVPGPGRLVASPPSSTETPSSSLSSSGSGRTPTPPPPYFPTSPPVNPEHTAPPPPAHASSRRRLTAESLALVPGDGRMGPRAMGRRAAQALVAGGAGAAAGQARARWRVAGPVYGVDPALPRAAHEPRWAAGAGAARRARDMTALQGVQAPGVVRPRGAGAAGARAAQRDPEDQARVEAALREVRRGVGKDGDVARTAMAVWELLEESRRARREREGQKGAEQKRAGGFKLGGARGRAM